MKIDTLTLLGYTCLAYGISAPSPCPCGYTVSSSNGTESWTFMNALETKFLTLDDIGQSHEWVRQEFNVTAQAGRGRFGKTFSPNNVESQIKGDSKGLQLRVSSQLESGSVPVAEIDSARVDLFWGSYRAGMKLTKTSGTCAAFFWYFNDTQEIDMEFLSREFDPAKGIYPVNLVIQSKQSQLAGSDASETNTFKTVNLEFDPTVAFHEYRFDFLADRVIFYADSKPLADMNGTAIPSDPGHLILQHWSNGNPEWSGGPPKEDAVITVSYVQAYFNTSSEAQRLAECNGGIQRRCSVPNTNATEASMGSPNLRDGQTNDDDKGSAAVRLRVSTAEATWAVGWLITWRVLSFI